MRKSRDRGSPTLEELGEYIRKHGHKAARTWVASKSLKQPPDIEDYALRLAGRLHRILDPGHDPRVASLLALLKFRGYLTEDARKDLATTLEVVAERALQHAAKLRKNVRHASDGVAPARGDLTKIQRVTLPRTDRIERVTRVFPIVEKAK